MCRNIKNLFNFDPPATDEEIQDAALQFVRKLSGFQKPSEVNETVFNSTVNKVAHDAKYLLSSLVTHAEHKNREIEIQKKRERFAKRFGTSS